MSGSRSRPLGASLLAIALVVTACGGGGGDDAADDGVVLRTQGEIAIDDDAVADTTTSEATAGDDAAEEAGSEDSGTATDTSTDDEEATATTSTTLPQEELTAGEALFEAVGVFQSCLAADGYEFIGIPDPALGDVPQNAQPYIDALIACAARSQIQERIAAANAAQADLTPEEVEAQNRQYVAFRECMIGRGWDIPEPTPDEFGLLFPGLAAATQWQGPPGEEIASTDDVGDCTSEANIDFGDDDS